MVEGTPRNVDRAVSRVRSHLPQLSPAMTKIADLILADPAALLELSITDAAARAGTSAATLTRFCHLLGYAGYVQFRVGAGLGPRSRRRRRRLRVVAHRHRPRVRPRRRARDMLRTLLSAQASALEATAALIDLDSWRASPARSGGARHLDIYGIAGSAEMASELRTASTASASTPTRGARCTGLASAAILPADAVAIGISNSGRTTETIEMLDAGQGLGCVHRRRSPAPRPRRSPGSPTPCIVNATPKRYLQPDDLSAKHAQLLVLDLHLPARRPAGLRRDRRRLTASRLAVSDHRQPVGTDRSTTRRTRMTDAASRYLAEVDAAPRTPRPRGRRGRFDAGVRPHRRVTARPAACCRRSAPATPRRSPWRSPAAPVG